ncbi:oxygenase MpaB family protein [Cellulosimicrobium sp. NPDC057127]|uniref:oxygenase MpaB family protein n=1 Tax=Cellulosimicrobium sp. NPDC057127 TaxID=3346026 RepID=UPI00362D5764
MVQVLERARLAAGDAIFSRVAGPDAAATRSRIHETPGPRWFPAGSPIQRVHGDASMFVGGLRALLLQSWHPLAMAGVAAHSGYRGDPWGRLQRTSTFLATTTFATVDDAQRAVDAVRAVHARVQGTAPDGRAYAASDPELLRWVHVAEAQSFLVAHQEYGRRPLDARECDEYVAQVGAVGRRLGVEDVPRTRAELDAAVEEARPGLVLTDAARDAARFLLVEPPLPPVVRPVYAGLAAAALASLPAWARPGLPEVRVPARLAHPAGASVTRLIRWALPPAP